MKTCLKGIATFLASRHQEDLQGPCAEAAQALPHSDLSFSSHERPWEGALNRGAAPRGSSRPGRRRPRRCPNSLRQASAMLYRHIEIRDHGPQWYGGLCDAMLSYSTIRYATIRYDTLRYATIRYNTIQYSTLLYYTILYYTILYYTKLCYAMLCYTILYYTIQVQPCTSLYHSSTTPFHRHRAGRGATLCTMTWSGETTIYTYDL